MCPFTVMPDYQKGKIYRIWDNAFTKCYIGSTVEPLSKRMTKHREKYNAYLRQTYPFTTSFALFDNFGFENCKIELLENFRCNSREELSAREGYHQRNEACVFRVHLGRTN